MTYQLAHCAWTGAALALPASNVRARAATVDGLKPFHFRCTHQAEPDGACSLTFVMPKGLPMSRGSAGHSDVYDFNTLLRTGLAGRSC